MSDFAGGADSGIPADSGQTYESQASVPGAPVAASQPSAVGSQPAQNAEGSRQASQGNFGQNGLGQSPGGPVVRSANGQFASPTAPQTPGSFMANQPSAGGQFSGGQFAGQTPGVLAAFRAAGYDTTGFNDDQALVGALRQQAEANAQYQKQIADYQRQLATRGQPLPGAFDRVQEHLAAPVEPKNGWNPPQYDTRNDQFFKLDEQSGRWVPNQPNVPYELVEAKNQYMDYRAAFAKEWTDNPVDTLWNRTEDRSRALVREELKSLFNQMQVTKDTNDWLERNKSVLFTDGQVDLTGDPEKLTAAGKLALQATDELDKAGVTDAAARRSLTERYMMAELSKQYFQEQQAAQADPAQRRYTIAEVQEAIRMAQSGGVPPQGLGVGGDGIAQPQAAPQYMPQQPQAPDYPGAAGMVPTQGWLGQPQQPVAPQYQPPAMAPQYATMAQVQQPGVMTANGWVPNPAYQATVPQMAAQYQQAPMQPLAGASGYMQPQYPQQQYPQQGFAPQQAYQGQPQMAPMTPEQMNTEQKRRFLGGVGHSSSQGSGPSATGEFVPTPSPGGKPNFLALAAQVAASKGLNL